MSHRIVKKQVRHQEPQTNMPHQNQEYSYQNKNNKLGAQLPRPIIQSTDHIYQHDKVSYRKNMLGFPPADSLFSSDNNYDGGPEFIRPTSAMMMGNPKKRNFPYGAWIMPFGSDNVKEVKVDAPLRCSRCKAYINPYFRLDGTKSSAHCNICGIKFDIENGMSNKNLNNTSLMTQGVIDFEVKDKMYIKKRLDIIKVVIAIEMGQFMYESGIFGNIIEGVKSAIQGNQFESKIRIGIVFFNDNGTTFLKIKKGENWQEKEPIKYVVKNSKSGFCCPLSDKEMLFDPNNEKDKLLYLLDKITAYAEESNKNKYNMNSVNYSLTLKCLLQNFTNETGRVMLFCNNAPKTGFNALRPRNQQQNNNPLKPIFTDYQVLARDLAKSRVGVDMYIFAKENVINHELATVNFISSMTGGSVYLYSSYNYETHGQNLFYTVYSNLLKPFVYDVDFTVRVSNGLNICGYGIANNYKESRDVSLSMMDPASSFTVTFEHEEKIQENSNAYLQYAMMYTTGNGERKIRVINYRYIITNKIDSLHEAVDYLAFANILSRQYIYKLLQNDPTKVREQFINRLIGIIAEYYQQSVQKQRYSEFYAHPNLGPAFAYLNTIINSRMFVNVIKSPPDYRIAEMLRVTTYGFSHFANRYYPKAYSISMDIYEAQIMPGDYIELETQEQIAIIPTNLPLNSVSIVSSGVYLFYTPQYIVIMVESQAPSDLLIQLFGTDNWDEVQQNGFPQLETPHNIRVGIIINELRRRNSKYHGIYLPVLVKTQKKKGAYMQIMGNFLKEQNQQINYHSFMDVIHKHVQGRIK